MVFALKSWKGGFFLQEAIPADEGIKTLPFVISVWIKDLIIRQAWNRVLI